MRYHPLSIPPSHLLLATQHTGLATVAESVGEDSKGEFVVSRKHPIVSPPPAVAAKKRIENSGRLEKSVSNSR